MSTANAVRTGQVTITCATSGGTQQTFQVNWDNANQYFENKGDIARLFCEGGHSGGGYTTFVSTSVTDLSLRYYNGIVPASSLESATPLSNPDSQTTVSDTPTVTVSDTQTVLQETQTVSSDTQTVETLTPVVPSDTQTSSETQTLTSESSTLTSQQETPTVPVEIPLPTPIPVVVPEPVVVPVPQPVTQPEPVPAPSVEETQTEAPLEEPALEEQPVVEEQPPVEEPSEHPVEEETPIPPVEEPEIQEQPEPAPLPSPQPTVEPVPDSQPDIAYEPPTVTLDNGVILTQEEAVAVALLQNPAELLSELFTNPAAVFSALGSVGADMSPEVREKSEKVVLSAVIAGNIATQASVAAAGAAAYRRRP